MNLWNRLEYYFVIHGWLSIFFHSIDTNIAFRDKNTHKQSFEFIFAFFLVYYGFISFMKFRNDDSQNYLCLDGVLSILCCTSKICWSNLFGQFRSLLNRYKPCGALLIIHSFLLGVSLYWPSIYLFDVKKNAVKSE